MTEKVPDLIEITEQELRDMLQEFQLLYPRLHLVRAIAEHLVKNIFEFSNPHKGRKISNEDAVNTVVMLALADFQGWSINTLHATLSAGGNGITIWHALCGICSRSSIPRRRTLSSRANHPNIMRLKDKVYEAIREECANFKSFEDCMLFYENAVSDCTDQLLSHWIEELSKLFKQ